MKEKDEEGDESAGIGLLQNDRIQNEYSPSMLLTTEVLTDEFMENSQQPLVGKNSTEISEENGTGESKLANVTNGSTNGLNGNGVGDGVGNGVATPKNQDSKIDSPSTGVSSSDEQSKLDRTQRIEETARENKELFMHTPRFVTALTDLADELIPAPVENRNVLLRKGLAGIQARFLPSEVLYLPVCNMYHRVKGIHIEESFCFSTKERVPCLLVVEVVDYACPQNLINARRRQKRRKRKRVRTTGEPQKFTMKLPFSEKQLQVQITKTVQVGEEDDGYHNSVRAGLTVQLTMSIVLLY
jgi:hypothetical protein